ncbi:MAG: toprim domain-containing protein [Candidatus Delongbacteria bacterium]|jgi:DNA gyrase/topoisomerase IV subunit B|nr:toprim domain-containing protein [Candidatus Delongbacteria bacterium]MDD4204474.1 toprim domain-containing protein [Candidatus Delongbacteria bacterium]MDY0016482.1 toprim domain-containing protein [Candidatus Delongbacteria bacterium]
MNSTAGAVKYDESKIQTLSSLEHIRLRTGMYIGRLGDGSTYEDGIYILLKEIVDNSIDEYIEGYGKRIDINISESKVSVRDYGRGIPLGKLIDCVSVINTGGKFNSDVFQYSVGLNGVGTKAVNALSDPYIVRSVRDGKFRELTFCRGKLTSDTNGETKESDGTYTEFVPDLEIFREYQFNFDYIKKRLYFYAYLNKGLKIYFNGDKIVSTGGLLDLLTEQVEYPLYEPIYYCSDSLEFAFTHIDSYGESYYSFVNGQYTNDGGTHQSAFKEAILKSINEFSKKNFEAKDVRDGIVGAVAVKVKQPVFESQTKNKLGNTEIKFKIVSEIKDFLIDYFYKHQDIAEQIYLKIALNEKIRKELKAVQQEAKELSKKTSIRIPKLKDCKYHFNEIPTGRKKELWRGDESVIFLTEGDSAAGSMISSRDVETQAIFALKGKLLNVHGLKRDYIYKNEEIYNIIKTMNIEDGIDNLRYSKIIIATDSDPDGLHIRNLLLTFFLHFYESLILKGHIYILETPLFRVRNKKETVYCYSDIEKSAAIKKLGADPEVTRFKGLGEISPNEFGRFIGPDMRLIQVSVEHLKDIPDALEFYMGKNTPERRAYIMENLHRFEETV